MKGILAGPLIIFIVLCCSGICIGSEKQDGERERQKSQDQAGKAKRVTKKVGPFEIGKKRIAVILDITEYEGQAYLYHSFEIIDEAGISYYKEILGPFPDSSTTTIEGIFKLEGKSGEGLIFYFDTGPNAPPAGKSFQIFGVEKGKVKPLSPPISVYGSIEKLPEGKSREVLRLFDGDLIKVTVWKGLIGVVIPLVVDFQKLTIAPLKRDGIIDIYFATPPDKPVKLPWSFYKDHNVNAKTEKIDATKGMNVKVLNAYAKIQLKKVNGGLDIDVSNLWLKVKINSQEGWINDLNDFNMLGLPPID